MQIFLKPRHICYADPQLKELNISFCISKKSIFLSTIPDIFESNTLMIYQMNLNFLEYLKSWQI